MAKQIERLERELGIRRGDQEIAAVMTRLGVTATHARVLLRLYAAGGRPITHDSLMDVLSTDSRDNLKTVICRIRAIVGKEVIGYVDTVGYHLTAPGLARVLAAIQPVEMQDVRG